MRKSLLIAIGALGLTATAGAQAQKPDIDGDLRCIALLSVAIGQATPDKQGSMIAGAMYFIGRLDGKAPNTDLKAGIKRILEGFTQEQAAADGQRCSAILAEKGQVLQGVGSELQTRK
jgi:hypothetical protein